MRTLFLTLALLPASLLAAAAEPAKPVDVPPPPPIPASVPDDDKRIQPVVTVIEKEDATVSEYRLAGKLYMVKVKPRSGPEYYLVDDVGDGKLVRQDNHTQLRPPMWIIKSF